MCAHAQRLPLVTPTVPIARGRVLRFALPISASPLSDLVSAMSVLPASCPIVGIFFPPPSGAGAHLSSASYRMTA